MASFFLVMPFRQVHGVSCCGDMWYILFIFLFIVQTVSVVLRNKSTY